MTTVTCVHQDCLPDGFRITDEAYEVFMDTVEAQARSLARTLLVRMSNLLTFYIN